MGYKQIERNETFAEVSLSKAMEQSRSLKKLDEINHVLDWERVDKVLLGYYSTGNNKEGARRLSSAYAVKRVIAAEVV